MPIMNVGQRSHCKYDLTSKLMKRIGIMTKKMIHRRYAIAGNMIFSVFSLSPLGDLRKIVSKLKSPIVIDMTFTIEVAGAKNGDCCRSRNNISANGSTTIHIRTHFSEFWC